MTTHEQPDADQEITHEAAARAAEDTFGDYQASLKAHVDQLEHIVGVQIRRTTMLEQTLRRWTATAEAATGGEGRPPMEPAAWVWYEPPELTADPQRNAHAFVTWYNQTYVGSPNGRARPIPDCWDQHPGLAMELPALAAAWHAANRGRSANPRDATLWHHQWRPGVISRLPDWVHPHCFDGEHRETGAAARGHRFAAGDDTGSGNPGDHEGSTDEPTTQ